MKNLPASDSHFGDLRFKLKPIPKGGAQRRATVEGFAGPMDPHSGKE